MQKTQLPKILLVDDLEKNLLALEAALRSDEVELHKAASGHEALELLLVHEFALALIDVQMPDMDGFELAELMRGNERTRRIPIIFVTAGARDAERTFRGYETGAVDFLFKPLDTRILKHKVDVLLEMYLQRAKLEETLRMNEELLAIVTHDLRSPLASMLMVADVLSHQNTDETILKHAGRIRRISRQLLDMVNELLDLSRARLAGGIPVDRRDTDLAPLASRVVGDIASANASRVIHFEASGDLVGRWDGPRIEQVIANLVGNALTHGGPSRPVEVRLSEVGDGIEISVRNDGAIAPELLPRVFEPFHRGVGQGRKSTGLGLGLYIVEQIVLAHGGRVTVQSSSEEGTTFRVFLPKRTGNTSREIRAVAG
ncbi:MAG: hybrid sensor histidine kinase/response regulator [Polyangiaceae bacterium]